jgi:hypothetical protein
LAGRLGKIKKVVDEPEPAPVSEPYIDDMPVWKQEKHHGGVFHDDGFDARADGEGFKRKRSRGGSRRSSGGGGGGGGGFQMGGVQLAVARVGGGGGGGGGSSGKKKKHKKSRR